MAQAVSDIWQALMEDGVMPHWTQQSERSALVQMDRELRGWAARDPDAEVGLARFRKESARLACHAACSEP
jgi:hypothetical protein